MQLVGCPIQGAHSMTRAATTSGMAPRDVVHAQVKDVQIGQQTPLRRGWLQATCWQLDARRVNAAKVTTASGMDTSQVVLAPINGDDFGQGRHCNRDGSRQLVGGTE